MSRFTKLTFLAGPSGMVKLLLEYDDALLPERALGMQVGSFELPRVAVVD